jgi:hypothetical protein
MSTTSLSNANESANDPLSTSSLLLIIISLLSIISYSVVHGPSKYILNIIEFIKKYILDFYRFIKSFGSL